MTRYILLGAFCVLIFIGALVGFGFIIAAAYAGLSEEMEPGWAMLIVGTALLVFCLIDGLFVWLLAGGFGSGSRATRNTGGGSQNEQGAEAADLTGIITRELATSLEKHPKQAAAAALIAGLALGVSPSLRQQLSRLMK